MCHILHGFKALPSGGMPHLATPFLTRGLVHENARSLPDTPSTVRIPVAVVWASGVASAFTRKNVDRLLENGEEVGGFFWGGIGGIRRGVLTPIQQVDFRFHLDVPDPKAA